MKRGPAPKDSARRQRRNLPTAAPAISLVPRSTPPPPAPPGLLKAGRDAWAVLWTSPLGDHIEPTDIPALSRLFQLRDERDRAYRGYRRERIQAEQVVERENADGSVTRVANGLRINPLFGVMTKLDAEIRQLEDRFAASMAARLKLGLQLGKAVKTLADMNRDLEGDDDDDADDPRTVQAVVLDPAEDA